MPKQTKNTICLWFDRGAEDAARFYAETFPDSSVGAVFRAPAEKAALAEYRAAGIDEVLLEVPDVSRDEILRLVNTMPERDRDRVADVSRSMRFSTALDYRPMCVCVIAVN